MQGLWRKEPPVQPPGQGRSHNWVLAVRSQQGQLPALSTLTRSERQHLKASVQDASRSCPAGRAGPQKRHSERKRALQSPCILLLSDILCLFLVFRQPKGQQSMKSRFLPYTMNRLLFIFFYPENSLIRTSVDCWFL